MPSPIFISRPSAGFSLASVIRGFQLTILGTYRALKNPELAKHGYYKKALKSVGISIIVQLLLWVPLIFLRWTLLLSAYISGSSDHRIAGYIDTITFLQNNVFNVGPLLISGIRFVKPEMDDLFLMSLKFVDKVYKGKHPDSDRQYYTALIDSGKHYHGLSTIRTGKWAFVEKIASYFVSIFRVNDTTSTTDTHASTPSRPAFINFLISYILRSSTTLFALLFSHIPIIGPLVLPLLSFYSFNKVVGTEAALVVFAIGFMVPSRMMIIFLSSFYGSRSLVRELLIPYFSRLPFSKSQKARWFSNREGIMFGFGAGFYLFMKIPFIGVLVYGLAEASTAYLVTKVSDPPPLQSVKIPEWTELQTTWTANDESLSHQIESDGFENQSFPSSFPGGWS